MQSGRRGSFANQCKGPCRDHCQWFTTNGSLSRVSRGFFASSSLDFSFQVLTNCDTWVQWWMNKLGLIRHGLTDQSRNSVGGIPRLVTFVSYQLVPHAVAIEYWQSYDGIQKTLITFLHANMVQVEFKGRTSICSGRICSDPRLDVTLIYVCVRLYLHE